MSGFWSDSVHRVRGQPNCAIIRLLPPVNFKDTHCVDQLKYPLNQSCGGSQCSQATQIKQPGSLFSTEYGKCDYDVGDGLTDPRVIIIGK